MAKQKKSNHELTLSSRDRDVVKSPDQLLDELRKLILRAREGVTQAVNSALVLLYWEVGERIRTEILKQKRAQYGEQIIPMLAVQLVTEFGNGFSRPNLFRMIRFAEVFPDRPIVSTLSRQLGWSHFIEIIPLKDDLQRDFYAEMCGPPHEWWTPS